MSSSDPSKGRRILFISTGLARGGAETQLVRLASSLRARGWEVSIASLTGTCSFDAELASHQISFSSLGLDRPHTGRKLLQALSKSRQLVRSWKPDIIVCFMYHANVLGSILAITEGVPTISSVRNEVFGGPLREILGYIAFRVHRKNTINSRNAAMALIERGVLPPDSTVVIPNAIAIPEVPAVGRQADSARFHWLAVGRLYPQKDYPNLLKAFRKVVDVLPENTLSIAGSGPCQAEIYSLIQELGLEASVRILGQRDDIPDLLCSSDALVLSSAWEGMPNVVMEAMAHGVPVVATKVGAVSELIQHGVTGLLCEPRDSYSLAQTMLRMAKMSPTERKKIGASGREVIATRYSVNAISDRWESLLLEQLRCARHQSHKSLI